MPTIIKELERDQKRLGFSIAFKFQGQCGKSEINLEGQSISAIQDFSLNRSCLISHFFPANLDKA